MEQLSKIAGQLPIRSQALWPESTARIPQNEISVYKGGLTTAVIIECSAVVHKAFPSLPIGFFDVFSSRLEANGFCDDRLRDAVNHVIDTCVYPTPTIAQFISFDKRFKVHTYAELLSLTEEIGSLAWSNHQPLKLPEREKIVWVDVDDIKRFNLECFLVPNTNQSDL